MAHPRWPGFNDKTGDPTADNAHRNTNRRMWRDACERLTFHTPQGRRRKKHLTRVEGANYLQLIVAVTADLARGDRAAAQAHAAEAAGSYIESGGQP